MELSFIQNEWQNFQYYSDGIRARNIRSCICFEVIRNLIREWGFDIYFPSLHVSLGNMREEG